MRHDEIIRRIERFPFRRAAVAAEWRKQGIYSAPRRNRTSDRQASSLSARRPDGNPLLVIVQRTLGRRRPVWLHNRSARRSPPHYRRRTHLLGRTLIPPQRPKMYKVELSGSNALIQSPILKWMYARTKGFSIISNAPGPGTGNSATQFLNSSTCNIFSAVFAATDKSSPPILARPS
jgi:hypothetical protein